MDSFWKRVTVGREDECWEWIGPRLPKGYGQLHCRRTVCGEGKKEYAHRIAYDFHYGGIPEGLQIDHLCRNRACVNPKHLEAVTCRENLLRGEHPNFVEHVRRLKLAGARP